MVASASVDVESLYAALDAERAGKGLSWRQTAAQLGLSPSTLSRLANGRTPDVSAFASMVRWLHMPADSFIRGSANRDDTEDQQPDLVASLAPLLRARRDLEPEDVEHLENLISAAVRRFEAERSRSRQ